MTSDTKIETVEITDDTSIAGYGVLEAGTYRVEMPSDYDASEVTAEDIALDGSITIRDGGFLV